jgi:hypothetical protein
MNKPETESWDWKKICEYMAELPTKPVTRVYIAGPISAGNQFVNVREAVLAGQQLVEAGLVPFIPHMNCIWEMICGKKPLASWLQWDFAWLAVCDAVLRLPGESPGSDSEVIAALRSGLQVFFSAEDVIAFYSS